MLRNIALSVLFSGAVLSNAAYSQPTTAPATESQWRPETPKNIKHDWIRLTSDEWLKGDIIALYDGELEFDSDELGMQTLDWGDIAEVISHESQSLRLTSGQIVEGRIHIVNDTLNLEGSVFSAIPKSKIISIAAAKESELDLWAANITFNLGMRSGNSDEQNLGLDADVQRRTAASRFMGDYLSNYTLNNDVTSVNNHRLNIGYDWFFSNKAFWRVANYEHFRDPFQNINSRKTLSTSLGYHIFDTKALSWDVTLGVGTQKTQFVSTVEDQDDTDRSPSSELGTEFEWDITRDIEVSIGYNLQSVSEDSGRFLHHLKAGIDLDLTKRLDFSVTFYLDSTAQPIANDDGTVPNKNDAKLLIGIKYEI